MGDGGAASKPPKIHEENRKCSNLALENKEHKFQPMVLTASFSALFEF